MTRLTEHRNTATLYVKFKKTTHQDVDKSVHQLRLGSCTFFSLWNCLGPCNIYSHRYLLPGPRTLRVVGRSNVPRVESTSTSLPITMCLAFDNPCYNHMEVRRSNSLNQFLSGLLCCNSSTNHSTRFFAISFQPREIPFMKKRDHLTNQQAQMEADTRDPPRSGQFSPNPRAPFVHSHRRDTDQTLPASAYISKLPFDEQRPKPPLWPPIDEPSNLRTLPVIQSLIRMDVPPPNDQQHRESLSNSR